MARLEELLKGKGYSDADLASLEPLLKDQRFRGVLEGQLGELESAKATAEMQVTQWSEWHQKTAVPTLDKYMGEAEQARTEAAQVRERLKIAEERGLLKVAQQQEEEKPAKGAPSDGFDPKKYNLVDESRIMTETAVQLMRSDINEEVQRMKAHLESLSDALGRGGPQGKKLDFVCQELGREINTIGSKSMTLEINQAVIAVKDSLEKIREQLRNVE